MEIAEISPIEHALNEVEEKTKELAALNVKYTALAKTGQNVSTNALSMSLNSAVDAPVNAGIPLYRSMFFNPDYVAKHPERANLLDKLRQAIDEQVSPVLWLRRPHSEYAIRSAS
jgi:dedicator of cytokinesis protein 3